jgi:hypothetical protein
VHAVDSSGNQLYMSSRPNFQPYVYLPSFFLSARVAFLLFLYLTSQRETISLDFSTILQK